MSTDVKLITAEEHARMPDLGVPTELVRGEIVERDFPTPRHGEVCSTAGLIVANFAEEIALGHVVNNAGIITERNPDTVRGGDGWFIKPEVILSGDERVEFPDQLPGFSVPASAFFA